MRRFHDRKDAGQRLTAHLWDYGKSAVVLGLPRGGVPVAAEVAKALGAALACFVVRKLGAPRQPELALGAVASGNVEVLNDEVIRSLRVTADELHAVRVREAQEVMRRQQRYQGDRPFPELRGKTVILVDDGVATGATMRAALVALRQRQPAMLIAAAPVGAKEACAALQDVADRVVCLHTPQPFFSVGQWYETFPQVEDDEVRALLL